MPSVTSFPWAFNLSTHGIECNLSSASLTLFRFNITLYESATDSQKPNWTIEKTLIILYIRSPDDLYSSTSLDTLVFTSNIDRPAKFLWPPQTSFTRRILYDRCASVVLNVARRNAVKPTPHRAHGKRFEITRPNNIAVNYLRNHFYKTPNRSFSRCANKILEENVLNKTREINERVEKRRTGPTTTTMR